ncbi:MAG: RNA polymerase sigma factor [Prevotellaceae bacterium]|nr:RNA polymerase sigma factor [Prevotella sp.]MDD7256980.1 RNA polymerase sigma factor [Prevotellaceae bacterium]MDY6130371.1 RNA polymerase sigma factor [Prevotella sp.]
MKKVSFRNDILPFKNVLYRLALRITLNQQDAEDVVQDTLMKVWNRREEWDEIDNIEAFVLTIARNLALDKMKRADTFNASIEEGNIAETHFMSNPYEQIIRRDRIEKVRELLDKLPEKQRSCMQLRDFEGKTYKEIAEILGISEEQVKVNIFRARQAIKQKYQEAEQYGL